MLIRNWEGEERARDGSIPIPSRGDPPGLNRLDIVPWGTRCPTSHAK